MAVKYCPKCNNEILPYLKTGELKKIENDFLKTFQCYFCLNCRIVVHELHEQYEFVDINYKPEKEIKKDGLNSKAKSKSS